MSITKWRNQDVFPTFNNVLENLFDSEGGLFSMVSKGTSVPAVNVSETDSNYEIEIAAPGLSKDDFKINLENQQLIISSEKEEDTTEEKKNYTRKEYNYSSFYRSFYLPENVKEDSITAQYQTGVLTIKIGKKTPTPSETRTIQIG